MGYSEKLAQRVRHILQIKKGYTERKMFGGLCLLMYGNMCCGIVKDTLMLRVGPKQYEKTLKRKHVHIMDFTGRPMKGFVYVTPDGLKTKAALRKWIELSLNFVEKLPKKI